MPKEKKKPAVISRPVPEGMTWRDAHGAPFYGFDDFIDGREITLTIKAVGLAEATNPKTFEKEMIRAMTFEEKKDEHDSNVRAMPLTAVTNMRSVSQISGELEPAKWPGTKVTLYGDPTVRNPKDANRPGGVRIKAAT